jgi:hypothetical protein
LSAPCPVAEQDQGLGRTEAPHAIGTDRRHVQLQDLGNLFRVILTVAGMADLLLVKIGPLTCICIDRLREKKRPGNAFEPRFALHRMTLSLCSR